MARSRRRFFSGSKALVTRRLYNTIARGRYAIQVRLASMRSGMHVCATG